MRAALEPWICCCVVAAALVFVPLFDLLGFEFSFVLGARGLARRGAPRRARCGARAARRAPLGDDARPTRVRWRDRGGAVAAATLRAVRALLRCCRSWRSCVNALRVRNCNLPAGSPGSRSCRCSRRRGAAPASSRRCCCPGARACPRRWRSASSSRRCVGRLALLRRAADLRLRSVRRLFPRHALRRGGGDRRRALLGARSITSLVVAAALAAARALLDGATLRRPRSRAARGARRRGARRCALVARALRTRARRSASRRRRRHRRARSAPRRAPSTSSCTTRRGAVRQGHRLSYAARRRVSLRAARRALRRRARRRRSTPSCSTAPAQKRALMGAAHTRSPSRGGARSTCSTKPGRTRCIKHELAHVFAGAFGDPLFARRAARRCASTSA